MKQIVILLFSTLLSISAYNQDFVNGDFSDSLNDWEINIIDSHTPYVWEPAAPFISTRNYYVLNQIHYFRQTIKNLNPIGEYNVEFDFSRLRHPLYSTNDTIDLTNIFVVFNYDTLNLDVYDTLISGDTVYFSSEFFNYQVNNTDSLQFSVNIKKFSLGPVNCTYNPKMTFDNFKLTQTNVGLRPEYYSESFRIFPNPSAGEFSIFFETNSAETKQITIYSSIGKTIYSDSFTGNNFLVSNAGLSGGVYFVVVENEGRKAIRKLIVY